MAEIKKSQTFPRKRAQQQRSQATVEALLEATARILVREGYDRASTNRIAEEAGTSVGSLYQYFPGKEALVAELIERHIERESLLMQAKLKALELEPAPTILREFISFLLQLYGRNKPLRKVFVEQVPKIGKIERVWSKENEIGNQLWLTLHASCAGKDIVDEELKKFLLIKTIMGVIRAATLQKQQTLDLEQMADQLSTMLIPYLQLQQEAKEEETCSRPI